MLPRYHPLVRISDCELLTANFVRGISNPREPLLFVHDRIEEDASPMKPRANRADPMLRLTGGVVAMITGWVVWRMFGPERLPRFAPEQVRPLEVPGRSVFIGETEIFVREIGSPDAPPVVLLHGAGFDGESNFYRIIPALTDHYRLIVPDHRAHGRSDRTRGRIDIETFADDLEQVLDALGIDRVAVFGYSMGGMVALSFAARHPERVTALVLGATAARAFEPVRGPLRVGMWFARGFTRLSITEQVLVNYHHLLRTGAIDPEHGQWMWNTLMSRDAALYWETVSAIWRFDERQAATQFRAPTLLFMTTRDQVMLPSTQRRLADLLLDPLVVEIDAGHEAVFTEAEDFTTAISAFIDQYTQPGNQMERHGRRART